MGAAARAERIDELVVWRPQPGPQAALLKCPVYEIFYGGARGGGKTDGMLGKNAEKAQRYGRAQKAIFFRRELPQLEQAIARAKEIYQPLGWSWREQKKTFISPTGATLKFRALQRDKDAEKYQGHDCTDVYFEELTNYPSPAPVMKMHAVLRSAAGVPCQLHGTGNPGGAGHAWVKARYIDPAPQGFKIIREELPDGRLADRVFIPARLGDNQKLLEHDPGYVGRLHLSGSAALVKAWLEGDWSIVEGAFFDCWSSALHVLRPFALPPHWLRFRSMDWGSARPFSVGWWAVASDDTRIPDVGLGGASVHRLIPRGALVRYREWYGSRGPNEGLRLTAEQVGAGIAARERQDAEITFGVLDPAAFAQDGGPSIAERIYLGSDRRVKFSPADNARVPQHGAMGGWDQMRSRLIGEQLEPDRPSTPMIYCFSTCADSIRTIPVLQHDADRLEDVDSDGEDHAADEWRYACMSRPWVRKSPAVQPMRGANEMTMAEAWRLARPRARGEGRI